MDRALVKVGIFSEGRIAALRLSVAVRPGADDQLLRTLLQVGEFGEVPEVSVAEAVVPAAEKVGGDVLHLLVVAGGPEPFLLPVVIEGRVLVELPIGLLQGGEVGEHFGAFLTGVREPGLRLQREFAPSGGIQQPHRPSETGHAAAIAGVRIVVARSDSGEHDLKMRRFFDGSRQLVQREIRGPSGANFAVGPRLSGRPFDGVVAVLSLADERHRVAIGREEAAAVLGHKHVPVAGEEASAALFAVLVVWAPRDQHRKLALDGFAAASGTVQVSSEPSSVSHLNHERLHRDAIEFVGRSRGETSQPEQSDRKKTVMHVH